MESERGHTYFRAGKNQLSDGVPTSGAGRKTASARGETPNGGMDEVYLRMQKSKGSPIACLA